MFQEAWTGGSLFAPSGQQPYQDAVAWRGSPVALTAQVLEEPGRTSAPLQQGLAQPLVTVWRTEGSLPLSARSCLTQRALIEEFWAGALRPLIAVTNGIRANSLDAADLANSPTSRALLDAGGIGGWPREGRSFREGIATVEFIGADFRE